MNKKDLRIRSLSILQSEILKVSKYGHKKKKIVLAPVKQFFQRLQRTQMSQGHIEGQSLRYTGGSSTLQLMCLVLELTNILGNRP